MRFETLSSKLLVIGLIWLVSWGFIGSIVGMMTSALVVDNPTELYQEMVQEVASLKPVDFESKGMADVDLIELSKSIGKDGKADDYRNFMLVFQGISSTVGFIISSLVICLIFREKISDYLKLNIQFPLIFLAFTPLVFISLLPIIGATGAINEAIQLPDFLSEAELWMKEMEFQNGILGMFIGSGNSTSSLMMSLLVMAVIPAVGEEFLFRGLIQRNLMEYKIPPHTAIFITGFIFSAIHFQFYGFLPRLVLGMVLGYLYYWSNSIWIPILGHFIQNGVSVVALYYMNKMPENPVVSQINEDPSLIAVFMPLIALIILFYYLHQKRVEFTTSNSIDLE